MMYRFAKLLQVGGKTADANTLLQNLNKILVQENQIHPSNMNAAIHLALTLTRLGRFKEANQYGQRVLAAGKTNPELLYRVAQLYAVQKKKESSQVLHDAVMLRFNIEAITNGDFYNVRDQAEYKSAIQIPMK
jgi:hypothetical protein